MDPAAEADQAAGAAERHTVTACGVIVTRTAEPFDEQMVDTVCTQVEGHAPGGVLSSGMEYPGRYSRWHMAYVDPCLEVVARGRHLAVRALNERGDVLLPAVRAALAGPVGEPRRSPVVPRSSSPHPTRSSPKRSAAAGRRPSPPCASIDLFAGDDPHLGLYGAFGYDLAFQFEPIRLSPSARPASATSCSTSPTR